MYRKQWFTYNVFLKIRAEGRVPDYWVCESWDAFVSIASAVIHEDLFTHLSWHASPVMRSESTRTNLCSSTEDPGLSNSPFAENPWTDASWIQYWKVRMLIPKRPNIYFFNSLCNECLYCAMQKTFVFVQNATWMWFMWLLTLIVIHCENVVWLAENAIKVSCHQKRLKGLRNYISSVFQIVLGGIEIEVGVER